MRPDDRELDEEIRGHIALSVQERIERGEDPDEARRAAYLELGYLPAIRDSVHRVWSGRWFDAAAALGEDLRIAVRSLVRAKGLAATVIVTLALGIGANAAIFSVVRGVLLRPLVNRGADELVYIRQVASGLGGQSTRFSIAEIADFKSRISTISAFGDFSTVTFTLLGLDKPRSVQSGVVSGAYFDVMGLRPARGRLLNSGDDGPDAQGAAVLTHRFWATDLESDPSVVGKTVQLGVRTATIVGVLEPSAPYPADTEIVANVVTSPHHLEATMVTERTHRMTELFGRLAPGASVEAARAELLRVHADMAREHPEAYPASAGFELTVTPLRDQIVAPARTILLVLLAAAAVVFVIACSNVANLILARSVRREGELAVRAALGASRGALRRSLLAESLLLCGAGAVLGVVLARPFVAVVAAYASRFSVHALDVTVDGSLLWVSAGLAIVAAVLLGYVPRLPATQTLPARSSQRRLRVFATIQIAFSFVLLAGAGTLVATLVTLQSADTGYEMRQTLAIDLPSSTIGIDDDQEMAFYDDMMQRIGRLPDVKGVAMGMFVPWRDAGMLGPGFRFTVEGQAPPATADDAHGRFRAVTPGFFSVLGVPLVSGRDFTKNDRRDSELVAIVSQSVARRLFADGQALNRTLSWTDPYFARLQPRRIVGVVADVDDENVENAANTERGSVFTVYHPVQQMRAGGRLFVRAAGDPYALVEPVTQVIREMSADQVVEHAATLEDVRAEVLAPQRLNAFVVTGFAGVALLIAAVGVAGVLAFSVSARTREFGVQLALGSTPSRLLVRVLSEGALIVAIGIIAGVAGGYAFVGIAARRFGVLELPGLLPVIGATCILAGAAVLASLLPAARASRVDVLQALRSE